MNYEVNDVAQSTGGWGFSIIGSHSRPLVHFEYQHQDKAIEARRLIREAIAIAINITPQS
jgi:hypothetical protein